MAKNPTKNPPAPKKTPPLPPAGPQAELQPGSPAPSDHREALAALSARISRLEELLGIQAKTVSDVFEYQEMQKKQLGDFRTTLLCLLGAVKRVQEQFGVNVMPKGDFYGIKF